jgi:hypothetical protein
MKTTMCFTARGRFLFESQLYSRVLSIFAVRVAKNYGALVPAYFKIMFLVISFIENQP